MQTFPVHLFDFSNNIDEYFSHMIQDDISVIICDICAAHKSDSESAPPTTIAEELKQDLEDVANFKGSPLEKQAALYCKRLGINYSKLSDAEFRQLVHILEKSKFFKGYGWERGSINRNLCLDFFLLYKYKKCNQNHIDN